MTLNEKWNNCCKLIKPWSWIKDWDEDQGVGFILFGMTNRSVYDDVILGTLTMDFVNAL